MVLNLLNEGKKKGKGHPSTLTVTTETILKSGYTVIIDLL